MKKWIYKHLVLIWAIASIVYAIAIHCLFSTPAPNEFFVHKWEAGDILTYVSTVSLGLLAVWQNKRFKDENDISQARLEELTKQANEISTVNKIIEYEADNLSRLKSALDEFTAACDLHEILPVYYDASNSPNPLPNIVLGMNELDEKLDTSFYRLCRELRIDEAEISTSKNVFIINMSKWFHLSKDCVDKLQKRMVSEVVAKTSEYKNTKIDFLKSREAYLMKREKNLNEIIYGNLTLAEIKARCYQRIENTEDTENE